MQSALFASRDLPRLVVDYADLVAEPERAVDRVASFLAAEGLRLSGERVVARQSRVSIAPFIANGLPRGTRTC